MSKRIYVPFFALILFLFAAQAQNAAPALELSGYWSFEARSGDGVVSGRLQLQEDGRKLSVTFWIDNHVLQGDGETDGKQFTVSLKHSDGSGPGHNEIVQLTGRLDGSMIVGSFDNGIDRGTWQGIRLDSKREDRAANLSRAYYDLAALENVSLLEGPETASLYWPKSDAVKHSVTGMSVNSMLSTRCLSFA